MVDKFDKAIMFERTKTMHVQPKKHYGPTRPGFGDALSTVPEQEDSPETKDTAAMHIARGLIPSQASTRPRQARPYSRSHQLRVRQQHLSNRTTEKNEQLDPVDGLLDPKHDSKSIPDLPYQLPNVPIEKYMTEETLSKVQIAMKADSCSAALWTLNEKMKNYDNQIPYLPTEAVCKNAQMIPILFVLHGQLSKEKHIAVAAEKINNAEFQQQLDAANQDRFTLNHQVSVGATDIIALNERILNIIDYAEASLVEKDKESTQLMESLHEQTERLRILNDQLETAFATIRVEKCNQEKIEDLKYRLKTTQKSYEDLKADRGITLHDQIRELVKTSVPVLSTATRKYLEHQQEKNTVEAKEKTETEVDSLDGTSGLVDIKKIPEVELFRQRIAQKYWK
ncbi:hypothetical protein EJ04DRAFT_589314 [Polyplosphaeria fusca]|uniref:Uncharacterized protein n=1 Tax=Polyplosphaeria fusca TaxID=682080 RepID=A0A9P4UYJ1_9PLEO|nr:hypothetical protein EJ04DRAFT_589314 [Polyplosphaeria fusca]